MTLRELGQQYLEQAVVLRARQHALESRSDSQDPLMQRRLYYLAVEANDCRRTGEYLLQYYREDGHDQTAAAQPIR